MVRSPVAIHASSSCLARQSTGLSQALGIRPAELHPPLNALRASIHGVPSARHPCLTRAFVATVHWTVANAECATIHGARFTKRAGNFHRPARNLQARARRGDCFTLAPALV